MKNNKQNSNNIYDITSAALNEEINEGVDNSIAIYTYEDFEGIDDFNDDEYYDEYGFLKIPDDDFECDLEDFEDYMMRIEREEEIPFT